jgi:hypothetical protein
MMLQTLANFPQLRESLANRALCDSLKRHKAYIVRLEEEMGVLLLRNAHLTAVLRTTTPKPAKPALEEIVVTIEDDDDDPPSRPFRCPVCAATFTTMPMLAQHTARHRHVSCSTILKT